METISVSSIEQAQRASAVAFAAAWELVENRPAVAEPIKAAVKTVNEARPRSLIRRRDEIQAVIGAALVAGASVVDPTDRLHRFLAAGAGHWSTALRMAERLAQGVV